MSQWKDMITVQGFKGVSLQKAYQPEIYLYNHAMAIKRISPEYFVFQEKFRASSGAMVIALIGCGKLPRSHPTIQALKRGRGELGLYMAIKGKKDLILIHRSWNTEAFNSERLPISDEEIDEWIDFIRQGRIL